jgi:hypothetical protein
MSVASYVALFSLSVMVLMYAFEERWPLAPIGFFAASLIAAASEFVAGHWPLGIAALGFALVTSQRRLGRRRRDGHLKFSKDFWIRRAH